MKSITNNIWTDVSLEVLHQRIAFINAELLATDDNLLDEYTLSYKKEVENRLQIIWGAIHPPVKEGKFYKILELLNICSHKGFQRMLIEKNITEKTPPDTKIYVSNEELTIYKQ